MSRTRIALLALGLALAGGGTGCARQAQAGDQDVQPAADVATLQVANDFVLTMDLYVVSGGSTIRLGAVGPGDRRSIVLDRNTMHGNTIEVVAQPMGGGRVVSTGTFTLQPGDVLEFNIASNPTFSTATVH